MPAADVLRHELLILGMFTMALPLLAVAGLGSIVGLMGFLHAPHWLMADMITVALEAGLPLAVGVMTAGVAAQEPAIELQLALQTPYRLTAMRRFALILAWTALIEVLITLLLAAAAPWALLKPVMEEQLTWLAPVLWFAAVGALLALLMRSHAASGAVLGGIWVAQHLLHGYFGSINWLQPWFAFATLYNATASFWLANRVELIATAAALFVAVWFYLRNTEWRFSGEEA
jgi:hypothetical protein